MSAALAALVGGMASHGIACQTAIGGVIVNGRSIATADIRAGQLVDCNGARLSVDEALGERGVLVFLRHLG